MEFLFGMLTMYLIVGLLLCLSDEYGGGVELFDGWVTTALCLPEIIIFRGARFIWIKIIHRGQKQIWKRENGKMVSYWVEKDGEE